MNEIWGEYLVSDDDNLLQFERIYELLSNTYWASTRSREVIQKSIYNSLCFGIYNRDLQIGFARCITDYSVIYYLADVIIDEKYRGRGLGKLLLRCIVNHETLAPLFGILNTNDAHELYKQFGFTQDLDTSMNRVVKR